MTGSVTNDYSKTFKCCSSESLLRALKINGPNSAVVGAALLSHIIYAFNGAQTPDARLPEQLKCFKVAPNISGSSVQPSSCHLRDGWNFERSAWFVENLCSCTHTQALAHIHTIHTCVCACVRAYILTYKEHTHIYIITYIYAYVRTFTHKYIRTHIQTHALSLSISLSLSQNK
jgi:hypothetical protein